MKEDSPHGSAVTSSCLSGTYHRGFFAPEADAVTTVVQDLNVIWSSSPGCNQPAAGCCAKTTECLVWEVTAGRGEVLEVHFAFIRRATEFKISSERAAKQDSLCFHGRFISYNFNHAVVK